MIIMIKSKNRGVAMVMTIILMSLLMAVMIVLMNASEKDMVKTTNRQSLFKARLAAESGMSFMRHHIENCELVTATTVDQALTGLYNYLLTQIGSVSRSGTSIIVASRTLPTGTFTAIISAGTSNDVKLSVTGTFGSTTRTITLEYNRAPGSRSPIFNYGFSSKGSLSMSGTSIITGKNSPSESNIYMSTLTQSQVITLVGSSSIGGEVFAANSSAYVSAGTNCTVAGTSGTAISSHVYTGLDVLPLPTVDITPFTTGVSFTDVTSSSTTSGVTLSNIKIKAGTNPTFTDCTLKGVVYLEAPNKVKFSGNTSITGVIVTNVGTSDSSSEINFSSSGSLNSPAALPDLPEYRTVRSLPGTSLLASGFSVKFTGSMSAVNGTMAADTFSFAGSGNMEVKGSIICYKNGEMVTLTGSQTILIDKSGEQTTPPGFTGGTLTVLAPKASTLTDSGL